MERGEELNPRFPPGEQSLSWNSERRNSFWLEKRFSSSSSAAKGMNRRDVVVVVQRDQKKKRRAFFRHISLFKTYEWITRTFKSQFGFSHFSITGHRSLLRMNEVEEVTRWMCIKCKYGCCLHVQVDASLLCVPIEPLITINDIQF